LRDWPCRNRPKNRRSNSRPQEQPVCERPVASGDFILDHLDIWPGRRTGAVILVLLDQNPPDVGQLFFGFGFQAVKLNILNDFKI
jgi:hypothetical protein